MNSTRHLVGLGVWLVLLSAVVHGCGGDSKATGTVGGSCFADGTCSNKLTCLSQICVQPDETGRAGMGGDGGSLADSGMGAGGRDCTASSTMPAPANGLIADFATVDGGLEIMGGFHYGSSGSAAGPTISTADGQLHITENGLPASSEQYEIVLIHFADCIDASAFSGVQFSISGSFAGCALTYASADPQHQDVTTGAPYATGPEGSYEPQATIAATELSSTPRTLMIPFVGATATGSPSTPLDKTKIAAVFWQLTIPAAPGDPNAPACVADLTIDNVAFY